MESLEVQIDQLYRSRICGKFDCRQIGLSAQRLFAHYRFVCVRANKFDRTDNRDWQIRTTLLQKLNNLVSKIDKFASLQLFGSGAIASIAMKTSDLDLGITGLSENDCYWVWDQLLKALYKMQYQFGKVTPIK
jgi:hypothetical protein